MAGLVCAWPSPRVLECHGRIVRSIRRRSAPRLRPIFPPRRCRPGPPVECQIRLDPYTGRRTFNRLLPGGKSRSALGANRLQPRLIITILITIITCEIITACRLAVKKIFLGSKERWVGLVQDPVITKKAIPSYRAVRSNSSTISLIKSNPDCQKASDRIFTPTSPRMASGLLDPPSSSRCRYFGTKAGPRSLYIR